MCVLLGVASIGSLLKTSVVKISRSPLLSEFFVSLCAFALCLCRHMGSAKFGSFLFLAAVLTKGAELVFCVEFPFLRPPSGPLASLSALATTYYGGHEC